MQTIVPFAALAAGAILAAGASGRSPGRDAAEVAALDTAYQAAVEQNDAATMDRILADDFVLVLGTGSVHDKPELLAEARSKAITWDVQREIDGAQKVRVWGDTAVVTAKLRVKGTRDGKAFDRTLWFSDTYVRTASGWPTAFRLT